MKMKQLMVAMLAATSAVAFTACDDDDDDNKAGTSTEYVDLGLSVKWATCNLGATTPEGDGDFYAWGQTAPSKKYSWAGYKYFSGDEESPVMTKYNEKDNKKVLDASDDAATAKLGSEWRMPTYEECTELTENCVAEWTEQNGVQGYKFTSKINGNSVFIPAAGYLEDDGTLAFNSRNEGEAAKGCYWSSTLHPDDDTKAMDLFFYKADGYVHGAYDQYFRYAAQPIRPVYVK